MCFSAPASFAAAGALAVAGAGALAMTRRAHDLPLAAMPLLFAAQQFIEGSIWLVATPEGRVSDACVVGYLAFAKVLWPVYAPLAVMLVEPRAARRRVMAASGAAGAAIAVYLAWGLAAFEHWATPLGAHLRYDTTQPVPLWVAFAYAAVIAVSLLASSQPGVLAFGVIVVVGAAVSALSAPLAFPSLWCFFAAAASCVLLEHFAAARRLAAQTAPRFTAIPRSDLIGSP